MDDNNMRENEMPEEEVEEARGFRKLLGLGPKKKPNLKRILGFYVMAGAYLLYTSITMVIDLVNGKFKTTTAQVVNGICLVIFAAAAVYLLVFGIRNIVALRKQEEEEAKREAEENGEEYLPPVSRFSAIKGLFRGENGSNNQEIAARTAAQNSVKARAFVYQNPASEEAEETVLEETPAEEPAEEIAEE